MYLRCAYSVDMLDSVPGDAMNVSRETTEQWIDIGWCDNQSNPFDAATPALIECYEANEAYYLSGKAKPNYPMPAIPLAVKYNYMGCINIDDMTDENDPVIVYMYDSWTGQNV